MRNPFTRWLERRDVTPAPPTVPPWGWWGGAATAAGPVVSPISALSVPSVFACCQVLSQDVARTPLKLRQQTAPGTYEDAVDHPLYEILSSLPNAEQTAYSFKHALQWQLLIYGRAFAEIRRVDGRVVSLWPLDAARMYVDRDASRRKRWTYYSAGRYSAVYNADGSYAVEPPSGAGGGQTFQWTFDPSAPPVLELTHESPILRCREIIGSALALQLYVARFFANNSTPGGVLSSAARLTDLQTTSLIEQWMKGHGGGSNAHRIAVMSGGVEFKPIAMDHDSAQMSETQKAISTAICGSFRVPPHKAGLLENTNYSNMESAENSYVTSTLDPLFECWEEALRRDVLTTRQYGNYTIQFDRSALVRNDVKALYDSLSSGIQNGFLSQNDARRALGLNPIENGDVYMVNSALQPVGAPPHVA